MLRIYSLSVHISCYRIYREHELNLRIKPKKRLVRKKPEPLNVPLAINETWSMDFMHDGLSDARSYRLLNVIDGFNRERLGMEVDLSLPSERVIRALDRFIEWRGKPKAIAERLGIGQKNSILNLLIFGRVMTWPVFSIQFYLEASTS